MSVASSSLVTQPSALGADALRPSTSGHLAGDVAGRSWFQDWGHEASSPVLHADVETQAKGLSADQHAERVLGHLVEGR